MSRCYCSIKGTLPSFFTLPPSPSASTPSPSSSAPPLSLNQNSRHYSFVLCDEFSGTQVYFQKQFLYKVNSMGEKRWGRGGVAEMSYTLF